MKRWRTETERRVASAGALREARALIPPIQLRTATILDIGDMVPAGDKLGAPTRHGFPILGFSGVITHLHAHEANKFEVALLLDRAEEFTWLELRTILGQVRRVLKDGGHVVLVWDAPWWHVGRQAVADWRGKRAGKYPRSKAEMVAAIREAGFLFGGAGTWAWGARHWAWAMKLEPHAGTA